jgi:CHAT domain-containing protein
MSDRYPLTNHLLRWGVVILATVFWVPSGIASALTSVTLLEAVAHGLRASQQGDFATAAQHWTAIARFHERAGQRTAQAHALTQLARAYQELGQYQRAVTTLLLARSLAEKADEATELPAILDRLGQVYTVLGRSEQAAPLFHEALRLAQAQGNLLVGAQIHNNLGILHTALQQYPAALQAYQESAQAAAAGMPALAVRACINAALTAQQAGQHNTVPPLLAQAWEHIQDLEASYDTAYDWLNMGLAYERLSGQLTAFREMGMERAAASFMAAESMARALASPRVASYAWGYLGKLYAAERRYDEALQLTRRAVLAAQQVHAPEALYRWQWQTGRLLTTDGQVEAAIAAYRRAVNTLQSIRYEITPHMSSSASFRETAGAVYFELVDLLLQRAAAVIPEHAQHTAYLAEARDTIELFKVAELQDYFRDDCVEAAQARTKSLDTIVPSTAVVYPILLPGRTELLVSLPGGLQQFIVPVGMDRLTQEIRELRRKLEKRTTREYLPHAQQLYHWLIRPLETALARFPIDTLVFVPDGPLRTIPMAALHDGTEFLIQKYALATTPGLKLTDPRPIPRENMRVLAAGLTEAVQGFPALPNVSEELRMIQHLYSAQPLFNQEFHTNRIGQELENKQFTVVHIASHGQFAADVDKSFILTFDDKLTMDRLEQFVGFLRFRDEPLELLTLSACQTAAGDDRAALGLAGVAIKAGARSALATLWYVSDQAASELVSGFYQQLQATSVSRAVALQRSQLQLLGNPHYQHPYYWAPFLMLNNWL